MPKKSYWQAMRSLKDFLSKAIDLSLFGLILKLLSDIFIFSEIPVVSYLMTLCTLPLLWIPVEFIMISCLGFTFGRILFNTGVKYGERLYAAERSVRSNFKLFIVLFPGINILYWICCLLSTRVGRPAEKHRERSRFFSKAFVAALMMLSSTLAYEPSIVDNFVPESVLQTHMSYFGGDQWTTFEHPSGTWKVDLPDKPIKKKRQISIQNTSYEIDEFIHEIDNQQGIMTICSIGLPKNLHKWGGKLLLGGSLDILVKNTPGVKVKKKQFFKVKSKHCLHYYLTSKEGWTEGWLIYSKGTVYRIEGSYQDSEKESMEKCICRCFDTFELKEMA